MLLLTKKDIREVFTMKDAIEADKEAFSIFSKGKSVAPLRTNIDIQKQKGQTLFMPSYVEEIDGLGVKIVSVFPKNIEKGIPSTMATMILIDAVTGQACAIIDGTYLTQLRTGAAAGAAIDILAIKSPRIGALIGTGGQAASQLEAMITARELEEIRIFDMDKTRAEGFVERMKQELSIGNTIIKAVDSSDKAIEDADIITVVTTSKKPALNGSLVKEGALIAGVGSYTPTMQELDPILLQRANKIYFESIEAVLAESGDFIIPLQQGMISKDDFNGDLGNVLLGKTKGRENDKEIIVFKTVGIATQDVVTAKKIYDKAIANNIGTKL